MAITVVGTPTNTGDTQSTSTIAPAVPSGAAADDIAVIYLGMWNAGATPTITPPSGFAQEGTAGTSGSSFGSGDAQARNYIFWKRLTGTGDISGTYSFSWTGAFFTTAQCVIFRGCIASGNPWESVATPVTGTFGSITSMSVTLGDAGDAMFWAVYNDTGGAHTPPTNFTEAADNDCGSCAYWMPAATGSQSASGGSIASSSSAGAWLGALSAAAGGGGGGGGPDPNSVVQAAGAWPGF